MNIGNYILKNQDNTDRLLLHCPEHYFEVVDNFKGTEHWKVETITFSNEQFEIVKELVLAGTIEGQLMDARE